MDLEPRDDGRYQLHLGLAAKWIIGAASFLLAWGAIYLAGKLEQVDPINTRTLLIKQQMDAMQLSLQDLPQMRRDLDGHELRLNQGEKERADIRADVEELQKLRGLR